MPTPLPPVPSVLRIDHTWLIGEDINGLTRLHAHYTGGPPSAADCTSLATTIDVAMATVSNSFAGADVALTGTIITDLNTLSGFQGSHIATSTGGRAGAALPAEVCALVNLKIARRYRGGKPRMYLPFFTAPDLGDPQNWLAGSVSALATAMGTYKTTVESASAGTTVLDHIVNVSYFQGYGTPHTLPSGRVKQGLALRAGGPVTDNLVSLSVNPHPASQRRRALHSR